MSLPMVCGASSCAKLTPMHVPDLTRGAPDST